MIPMAMQSSTKKKRIAVLSSIKQGACNFYHGLALVEKNGKLSYIDHDGVIVWQEK